MIQELKNKYGRKCSAISLNKNIMDINIPKKQLKFCEAVNVSFSLPIQINHINLVCPGARRSLGFDKDDEKLAITIHENNKIPLSYVTDLLKKIPCYKESLHHVNLGITEEMESLKPPDLYILYLKPDKITEIMHRMAQKEISISIYSYSLLSVCGSVFVNSYLSKSVSISFGCPESRNYGGVEENEVVVGIPGKYACYLTN